MRLAGLHCEESFSESWVAYYKKVGRGDKALAYLGLYINQGVLPECRVSLVVDQTYLAPSPPACERL